MIGITAAGKPGDNYRCFGWPNMAIVSHCISEPRAAQDIAALESRLLEEIRIDQAPGLGLRLRRLVYLRNKHYTCTRVFGA